MRHIRKARRRVIVVSAMARRSNAADVDAALLECHRIYGVNHLDIFPVSQRRIQRLIHQVHQEIAHDENHSPKKDGS